VVSLDQIRVCMRTALKLTEADAAAVDAAATPLQVPGWTSLAHVQLIIELEKAFDVMFDADEIGALASVAAIVAALERRKA